MVIFWTLYFFREKTLQKALKTIHDIDIKYQIAYFRILKKLFFEKWKNVKSKTQKPQKSQKSRKYYSEFSYFRVFNFALQPKSKNLDLKILEKNFRGFWVFDLPGFSYSYQFSWCRWGHDEWFWHWGAIRAGLCYKQRWSYYARKSICLSYQKSLSCWLMSKQHTD